MANPNIPVIDSYEKTIASTATPVNVQASSGAVWIYAKDVVIKAVPGNTTPILIGNRTRQAFTLAPVDADAYAAEEIRLSTLMNRMSQSAKFDLREIFVKAGTNGDKFQVLLIDPTLD